jgi:hypothetical protein
MALGSSSTVVPNLEDHRNPRIVPADGIFSADDRSAIALEASIHHALRRAFHEPRCCARAGTSGALWEAGNAGRSCGGMMRNVAMRHGNGALRDTSGVRRFDYAFSYGPRRAMEASAHATIGVSLRPGAQVMLKIDKSTPMPAWRNCRHDAGLTQTLASRAPHHLRSRRMHA